MSSMGELQPDPNAPEGMQYSLGTHISFSIGGFIDNFSGTAYGVRTYAFYETVLGLSSGLTALAYAIYGIWNMINDPIVGFLSDRKHRLIERFGRRFPLILFVFPFALSYLLIYFVPVISEGWRFVWLLGSICIFDLLYSIWQLNYLALIPAKFTNSRERTRIGAINTIWGILGVVMGMLLPPMLIESFGGYETLPGYLVAAGAVAVITLIAAVVLIPGIRENKALRAMELQEFEKRSPDLSKPNFFKSLIFCLKHRNFTSFIVLLLGHAVMTNLMLGSLQYWVQFVIPNGTGDDETIVGAALLVGVLISTPLWALISRKYGNRIAFIIGGFAASAILLLFFLFATSVLLGAVLTLFVGISIGAVWTLMYPGLSEVIDELTVTSKLRNEGIYTGIRTFFSRFAFVIQAVTFGVVHILTGFDDSPDAISQTPLAQLGIRIHMSLIPMIFYLIGAILIWRVYRLTPAKVKENRAQLALL